MKCYNSVGKTFVSQDCKAKQNPCTAQEGPTQPWLLLSQSLGCFHLWPQQPRDELRVPRKCWQRAEGSRSPRGGGGPRQSCCAPPAPPAPRERLDWSSRAAPGWLCQLLLQPTPGLSCQTQQCSWILEIHPLTMDWMGNLFDSLWPSASWLCWQRKQTC